MPPAAEGAENGPAESLIREGLRLRRAGRDIDALEKLQRAYDLEPTPRAAAQVGLCLQALGRWVEADFKLSEALTSADDPWIKKNGPVIKQSIEDVKAHVGRVEVIGSPEGAEVSVAGKVVGRLPLATPVPVDEGTVDIEVRSDGHEPLLRSLAVKGGQYQRSVFRLSPLVTAPSSLAPAPSPTPGDSADEVALGVTADAETREPTPLYRKGWFWGVVGAALVGGAVAAVLLSSGSETEIGPVVPDQMENF